MTNFSLRLLLPAAFVAAYLVPGLASAQEAPAPEEKRCMVWRVKGEKSTVYLAGSIHILHEGDYPLPGPYEAAYEDSARLAFEIPPKEISSPETAKKMLEAGSYPKGETIDEHVDEETVEAVAAYLKESGIPFEGVKGMRPWMISLMISMLETMKHGAKPEFGVNHVYSGKADEDDKPTAGLETVESQVAIFSGLTPELQKTMLEKTLLDLDGINDQFKTMLEAWKNGDSEALRAHMFKEADEFPGLMEALLFKRNQNWIDQIVGYIEGDENVMVIVGAGHLVGEGSVIDLLEKRGFKAEQLTYVPAKK